MDLPPRSGCESDTLKIPFCYPWPFVWAQLQARGSSNRRSSFVPIGVGLEKIGRIDYALVV